MEFKKGDKVIWIGKKPEMYYLDLTVGKEYIVHSTITDGSFRDVVVYKEGDKGTKHYFMMEDNFTKAPERQPKAVKFNENENGSQGKLWLQVAKFADRKGNTTTIKRSPCRHYYIKRPGAKQVRATKAQVKAVLEQVAGNI